MLFARDGDRSAFADIMRTSASEVARFVGHIAAGVDSEEVVQDTFIRLWRALPMFRQEASGRTFLFGIARRAAIDELRRMQRRRRIADVLHVVANHSDLSEVHAMDCLVDGLTPTRHEAFVLTQIVGLTYDEAAAMVGVPVGTIRSRVARARSDLATGLRDTPPAAATG